MRRHQGHPLNPRPLSAFTRERLEALFLPEHRAVVEQALIERLDQILPGRGPIETERFQCAVLRVSGGLLSGLEEALELARLDWRDLLVAARFFEPPYFRKWQPRGLTPAMIQQWHEGAALTDVAFRPGDAVRVSIPGYRSGRGHVRGLVQLEPWTKYRVEMDPSGEPGPEVPYAVEMLDGSKRTFSASELRDTFGSHAFPERDLAPTMEVWESCLEPLEA